MVPNLNSWIVKHSKSYYHWSKPTWPRPCTMNWSNNKTRFNIDLTSFFFKHCTGNARWLWRSGHQIVHQMGKFRWTQKQPPCASIAALNRPPRNYLRTGGDGGALWDKTRSFRDIQSFTLPRARQWAKWASKLTSERCERTDERVAQYLRLVSCLFQTIVRRLRRVSWVATWHIFWPRGWGWWG